MKVSATMSVKPPRLRPLSSPLERLLDLVLSDWWIDVVLMLFIVGSMLYLHQ
ncbi:MAG: hypothetical protein QM742_02385 [Aquabacterium sp.]